MPPPWNDWYHITGNTYGSWPPGDARTWVTRHHRTHIDQFEAPSPILPSGETPLAVQSRRAMKRPPVSLSPPARELARDAIITALHFHRIQTAMLAVTEHHIHLLARFPDHNPRKWLGIAKKQSALALAASGLIPPGGAWAVRTHCDPITDRPHQLRVADYIAAHAAQGASLWRIKPRDSVPGSSTARSP
jgi:hypothetical protein